MERGISEAKRRFLSDESQMWVERGIISPAQRDGIMGRYTVARRLPAVVLTLGAAMIGIGVLCLVAANWEEIPRLLKIAVIVGSYAASVAGAYACEARGRRTVSDLLLFLSGFLLLGGLALLSQIFHMAGSLDALLLTWLVVYAPTFLLVRNVSIFQSYEAVAIAHMCAAFGSAHSSGGGHGRVAFGPWQPFAVMLLVVAVAWWSWYADREIPCHANDSRLKNFLVGGSTRRIMLSNFMILVWFTCFCVINSRHEALLPYVGGVLAIGAAIGVIAWRLDAPDLDWQSLVIVSLCGLALSLEFVWSNRFWRSSHEFTAETVGASIALGAYLAWRITTRRRYGGWAAFFFCALLARWYFDMFFDFMDKGVFFLAGGALLVAAGFGYAKWSKRALRPIVSGGGGDE
ncbi:MAG: DUF2157 domain-containing protein [Candidatus Accumulibacter sp.]|nr:DUF2157 domain-containing protein [Accumulibacter sp.]